MIYPAPLVAVNKKILNGNRQASNRDTGPSRRIHGVTREDDPISHPAISEYGHKIHEAKQQFVHDGQCSCTICQRVDRCLHGSARYAVGVAGHPQSLLGCQGFLNVNPKPTLKTIPKNNHLQDLAR